MIPVENLIQLNIDIYHGYTSNGWTVIDTYSDDTGLFLQLFQKSDDIIMVVRGSENKTDYKADTVLLRKKPGQFYRAENYYKSIKDKYKLSLLTGHSLGGSLVQMLGNEYNIETSTFAAYGTGHLSKPKHADKITNYGSEADLIYTLNLEYQIGKTYLIPYAKSKHPLIQKGKLRLNNSDKVLNADKSQHNLENWNGIKGAIQI